ncbi:Fatty acid hydroxylase superfamily [Nesidiocoris tenuis]|uniref:Alkylglycerol monooxygenase n=1 Tax=Nesidiocoris tenuis TaxID=355587 RepID=A0ABN7AYV4_9HEMI|nr:Fatty acid hydroxylase superfamily [Nesidiocoris tenuis]
MNPCWPRGKILATYYQNMGLIYAVKQPPKATSWPFFIMLVVLENLVLWLEKKPILRLNDSITSLSHGLLVDLSKLLYRGTETAAYVWIYENYRLAELPWDSVTTWYLTALGVDFCYYWVHRACHEVHILWAQHQVHHSSEDYNLTIGLRQSVLQGWCGFIFYLPLALCVPPPIFFIHQQFNVLYQFWLHTETVRSLGPLEWVLSTPRHHRVHHGSTLKCLDKNYGGTLIIWDRLFGTFAEEPKEEIIYGLVMNQPSFNPLYLQVFYNMNVINKFGKMEGWANKLSAVFKGPSWLPGRPWTGAEEDKIDVKSRKKFDVELPTWCNVYIALHFIAVVFGFQDLAQRYLSMDPLSAVMFVVYVLASVTMIGFLLENRQNAFILELVRCSLIAWLIHSGVLSVELPYLKWFFVISMIFWLCHAVRICQFQQTVAKVSTKVPSS